MKEKLIDIVNILDSCATARKGTGIAPVARVHCNYDGEVLPYRQPHGHNNLIAVLGRQHRQQGQQFSSGNQPLGR